MRTAPPHRRNRQRSVVRGIAAGAVAGLVASWAMSECQRLLSGYGRSGGDEPQSDKPDRQGDDAPMNTAEAVADSAGQRLSRREKQVWAPAVHYVFGAATGAVYGALAEMTPLATAGVGMLFGSTVWATADEIAVPALGLAPRQDEVPARAHAQSLLTHLVYGITAETARRALRGRPVPARTP